MVTEKAGKVLKKAELTPQRSRRQKQTGKLAGNIDSKQNNIRKYFERKIKVGAD